MLIVGAVLCCGSATYADARKDLADAVALYNQQKFADALSAFESVAAKNPGEPSPIYYEANCQIALGRTSSAISLYKSIVAKFPKSAEAGSAKSVLQRMGIKGAEDLTSTSADTGKSAAITTRKTGGRTSMSAEEKEGVIEKLVVPVRALADRPNVSAFTLNSIKEALTRYPTPLLSMLYHKNCKIYVTPTMIDKEPGLANTQPSGYEDGKTFRNCPGMFDGSAVVLCEKEFIGDGPDLRETSDIIGTLRHELGHAVDRFAGRITATENFKHQYLLDLGTIDDDTKNKLAYYCQKDRRGPAETFAELMCFKYGGRPNGNSRTALVSSSFKLSKAYLDSVINEIDGSKSTK